MEQKKADRAARFLLGGARAALRLIPPSIRKNLEDRLFYVIFQKTRVENDAYGWRPPETPKKEGPGDGTPPGPGAQG